MQMYTFLKHNVSSLPLVAKVATRPNIRLDNLERSGGPTPVEEGWLFSIELKAKDVGYE